MKKVLFLLSLILLVSSAQGTIIKGSLVNSASGEPIASARLSFRIGDGSPYPTTTSNTAGLFATDLSIPQNYPLQIIIESSGYNTKQIEIRVSGDTIDVGTISLNVSSMHEIQLLGTVIDSVSHLPVSGAVITITQYKGELKPYMDFTADTAGSFKRNVIVSNGYSLICTVSDSGYYPTSFSITTAMDSVSHTVLLRPIRSIRVMVSGQLINFITHQPISNARVILRTNYHGVIPDTSYTNSNGMFSRSVEAGTTSSAIPTLSCNINVDGYTPYSSHAPLASLNPIDFGEIPLINVHGDNVKTLPLKPTVLSAKKTGGAFISLNGKCISRQTGTRIENSISSQMILEISQERIIEKKHLLNIYSNQ